MMRLERDCWLLGNDLERFEMRDQTRLEIAQQAMEYYRILRHRYQEGKSGLIAT